MGPAPIEAVAPLPNPARTLWEVSDTESSWKEVTISRSGEKELLLHFLNINVAAGKVQIVFKYKKFMQKLKALKHNDVDLLTAELDAQVVQVIDL